LLYQKKNHKLYRFFVPAALQKNGADFQE